MIDNNVKDNAMKDMMWIGQTYKRTSGTFALKFLHNLPHNVEFLCDDGTPVVFNLLSGKIVKYVEKLFEVHH